MVRAAHVYTVSRRGCLFALQWHGRDVSVLRTEGAVLVCGTARVPTRLRAVQRVRSAAVLAVGFRARTRVCAACVVVHCTTCLVNVRSP